MAKSFQWLDRRVAAPGPYLTLVRSEKDFLRAVKHLKAATTHGWINTPHADATAHFFDHPDGNRCVIVALRESGRSSIEIAGLLVHEAVHVVQEYFAWIGEHTPGSEQQAYATQAISQELMTEYARQITEKP